MTEIEKLKKEKAELENKINKMLSDFGEKYSIKDMDADFNKYKTLTKTAIFNIDIKVSF